MSSIEEQGFAGHGERRRLARPLLVLALQQIIAWGTIGFPTVLAPAIAIDLDLPLSTVFAGQSVMSVVTALVSPACGGGFVRHGARRMLAAGALVAAPGLLLIAAAAGPIVYFAGWVLIGLAGGAMLTTGAHIFLNEMAGAAAKGPISLLMVMTGLSSAIFLPLTAALENAFGWRGTCATYAAVLVFLVVPLVLIGLPSSVASAPTPLAAPPAASSRPRPDRLVFLLIAAGIALNAFVTFGLNAVSVQLFRGLGQTADAAIAFASAISIVQVTARGLDIIAGARSQRSWDGLHSGVLASVVLPVGLIVPIVLGDMVASIVLFVALFGFASGVLAVARSTIPLRFYDRHDYARIVSRIGLPLNLMVALSPPLMAALLTGQGPDAVLILGATVCLLALGCLLALLRRPTLVGG